MIKKLIFGTANIIKNYSLVGKKQTNKQTIQILRHLKKKKFIVLTPQLSTKMLIKKLNFPSLKNGKLLRK